MIGNNEAMKVFEFFESEKSVSWIASKSIKNEYKLIINRKKFAFNQQQKNKWQEMIDNFAVTVITDNDFHFSRDISDGKFIRLALTVEADYLLTYDKLLLGADYKISTSIVEPVDFFKRNQIVQFESRI